MQNITSVKSLGFTLIELMLVVAIISILAMVAIPSYQDYLIRTRITEGLQIASAAKTAVAETQQVSGVFPTKNSEAGLEDDIHSALVSSLQIGENGKITLTYNAEKLGVASGENTLEFKPQLANGVMSWDCKSGTLLDKYRPVNCRNASTG